MATSSSDTAHTTASVQNCFDLERYMIVYWYAYLLQLLVLTCDSSADPWKMASKMGEHHCRFYEKNSKDVLKCLLEIGRKILIAACSHRSGELQSRTYSAVSRVICRKNAAKWTIATFDNENGLIEFQFLLEMLC